MYWGMLSISHNQWLKEQPIIQSTRGSAVQTTSPRNTDRHPRELPGSKHRGLWKKQVASVSSPFFPKSMIIKFWNLIKFSHRYQRSQSLTTKPHIDASEPRPLWEAAGKKKLKGEGKSSGCLVGKSSLTSHFQEAIWNPACVLTW